MTFEGEQRKIKAELDKRNALARAKLLEKTINAFDDNGNFLGRVS